MPCKEEEDEVNRWSSESRVKLALAMPKYRANESRVKLAWLCRVQPIFNEVNRDRGRQSQPTTCSAEERRGEERPMYGQIETTDIPHRGYAPKLISSLSGSL